MNRNIGLSAGFLAVLAVFMRAFVPSTQVSGPAEAPAAAAGKKAEASAAKKGKKGPSQKKTDPDPDDEYLEGPWLATRHFYGPTGEPVLPAALSNDPAGPTDDDLFAVDKVRRCSMIAVCALQLSQYFGIESRGEVSFLLATVPDPIHSRLSLFTDSSIQAIERAATDAGWRFVAQWMPWNDKADPDEKDPTDRREQRADLSLQEKQPGAMVFRLPGPGNNNKLLVVFLAGETPTAGINPAQFQLALAYMDAVNRPDEVRIQGPSFSGSFISLTRLLVHDRARNYRIRSATATNNRAETTLEKEFHEKIRGRLDFHGTTENIDDEAESFVIALDKMGIPKAKAALLVEDESGFSQRLAMDIANPDPNPAKHISIDSGGIKVFRFPRDISHLRNAYREAVQSSKQDKSTVPDLDFSLKDPESGEDSTPTYSTIQTPLAQNGVINEITNAIRRDGIRLVNVEATNVLDVLFLARVLKQRCPDTRLMVSSPDVLYTQEAQTEPLTGTLALSSYPMFYASNQWMRPWQRQSPQIFANADAESVYNATLLLLLADAPLASDFHWKYLSDYQWKSALKHPPTWVLVLDRQGFQPVDVLPHLTEAEKTEKWFQKVDLPGASSGPQLPSPPGLWSFVSTALALSGVLISVWIFVVTLSPTWQVDARLALTKIAKESGGRPLYLFLFLMLLVSMLTVIWSPVDPARDTAFLLGLAAAILLLFSALLVLLVGCRGSRRGGVAMMAVVAFLAGVLYMWFSVCSDGSDRSLFFSLRALELRVGSSPTWPILAALGALLAWSFTHLTRFYLAACQKPEALTTDMGTILQPRLNDSFASFNDALESPGWIWKKELWWLFMVLGGLMCVVGRIDIKLRSVEGGLYDMLATGLQLLVMLTLLGACLQVRYLWHSFQSFLSCLGVLPLANSFIRTDRSASNRPIWVRRLNLQSIDIHARSMVVLHDIALLSERDGVVDGWMEEYRELLTNGLLKVQPPPTRAEALDAIRDLRELHKTIAEPMFEVAFSRWLTEPLFAQMLESQTPPPAASEKGTAAPPANKSNDEKFGDLVRTFLALHYSSFILYGIRQIQNLVLFLSIGFLLLVFSMSSYSFQSPEFIGRLLLALFAVITTVVWMCMSGMERDPIISRIGGTEPGKLNTEFYLKLLGYGGLPLLGILASQFPSISNFLLSAIQPALEKLR
jgi:hypothetical protein